MVFVLIADLVNEHFHSFLTQMNLCHTPKTHSLRSEIDFVKCRLKKFILLQRERVSGQLRSKFKFMGALGMQVCQQYTDSKSNLLCVPSSQQSQHTLMRYRTLTI